MLASDFKSDLRDTADCGRRCVVDFSAGKTQLVLFDRSHNSDVIDVKMHGSVLENKSTFNIAGIAFLFLIVVELFHCLYCKKLLQENWSLESFY